MKKILIVEDDLDIQEMIQFFFRRSKLSSMCCRRWCRRGGSF